MNQNLIVLGFQETASDSSIWIIIGIVLVLLFFVFAIVVIGLVIFFVMRKRKKAQAAAVSPELEMAARLPAEAVSPYAEPSRAYPRAAPLEAPPPAFEPPTPIEEMRADAAEAAPAPFPDSGSPAFDPSSAVARFEYQMYLASSPLGPRAYGELNFPKENGAALACSGGACGCGGVVRSPAVFVADCWYSMAAAGLNPAADYSCRSFPSSWQ